MNIDDSVAGCWVLGGRARAWERVSRFSQNSKLSKYPDQPRG